MRLARRRLAWPVAVVLALALGVALGARLLPGPVAAGLRADNAKLGAQIAELTEQRDDLSEKLSAADEFDSRVAARIVREALAGTSVALFRTPDADDADVEAMARLLALAGATLSGTIGLTREFVEANSAEKLRSVVNSPIVPAGARLDPRLTDPAAQAGDLVGIAVLANRDPAIPPVGERARDTVLAALRDTGFIAYRDDQIAPANAAVVVTGGALPDTAGNQGVTVARFAAGLAPHAAGVVLAGRDGSASGVAAIAVARADAATGGAVTTVDDIGSESGRITAVLALRAMVAGAPPASYGIGAGADAVTVG